MNNSIYKTCPHCNSKYAYPVESDIYTEYDKHFCPMCNMNKLGVEKERDGRGKTK